MVPIETEEQRAALARACELANRQSGSLIPEGYRYVDWQFHCYYLCRKVGLTGDQLGITMHGLRHGYLNEQYHKLAGQLSPVQGGTGQGQRCVFR